MLTFEQNMTINEIEVVGNQYIQHTWKTLYESMYEELLTAFHEIGDAAYGMYLDQLMPTVFESLEKSGLVIMESLKKDDFIIGKHLIFRNSLEKWGTEDNRSRIFWTVIRNQQGEPIGTLLTEIPHSHLKFEVPSAPRLYALQETERRQIVQQIKQLKEQQS